ncbi:hypothetical protein [Oceanispirochaeta sp.]|jgi:hypothetical protein|uniref:hypothetical protein n=1 Tax=Oceanispirochaeta sp. TaxID=2035350 RepID=UPI0026110543|nr:hypothetical protein [Oceanispirochaeta sp.]MDA3958210.1 hypothetical protein [Oceanispirochaeta sp.]
MGECEFIEKCLFFNNKLNNKSEKIEEMKVQYCQSNNLNCARYMVANALGKEMMPEKLFPHEKLRAYLVIAENG